MKKLSFNISELVGLYKGTSFRKIGVVKGDAKEGVEIHGIIYSCKRRGRARSCVVDRGHDYSYFPIVLRGSKKKRSGSIKEARVSIFIAHSIRATSQ